MLNRAWEEIAENKKQVVIAAERAEASVLAAKEAASLHYEALLRKAREEASAQEATLSMTIHQLRSSIARDSERAQWREEEFKKEIQVGFPPLLGAACVGFLLADVVLIALVGAGAVRRFYRRHALWVTRASGVLFLGFGVHAIASAGPGLLRRV